MKIIQFSIFFFKHQPDFWLSAGVAKSARSSRKSAKLAVLSSPINLRSKIWTKHMEQMQFFFSTGSTVDIQDKTRQHSEGFSTNEQYYNRFIVPHSANIKLCTYFGKFCFLIFPEHATLSVSSQTYTTAAKTLPPLLSSSSCLLPASLPRPVQLTFLSQVPRECGRVYQPRFAWAKCRQWKAR